MGEALEYRAELLTPEKVEFYWPSMSAELDKIPQYWAPWWTKDAIYTNLMNGGFTAWGAGTGVEVRFICIAKITFYPANRILQTVVGFGHDIENCLPVVAAVLHRYAVLMGCTMVEVVGRPGWYPMLAPHGFRKQSAVFSAHVMSTGVH